MRQKPIKQLLSDCSLPDQLEGTIRHGKNGIQNHKLGSVINEPGFLPSNAKLPYEFNGVIETDTKPIIFSTNDVNSAIGFYDPVFDEYIPILDDKQLPFQIGFKKKNYITGKYQKNNKNEYVVAFTDKNLPPMYLNCTSPGVLERVEDLYFFSQVNAPKVRASLELGGTLPIGSYKAFVKLSKDDGTATQYITNSAFVVNSEPDEGAVRINISSLDQTYHFVTIAILRRIEGVTTAVELPAVPVSQEIDYLYTGLETFTSITLEELLIPWKRYSRVGTIGQLNDNLYFGNLTEEEEILYQQYANNIRVQWESKLVDMEQPQPEIKSGELRGFAHDEVYAFYVRLILKNGTKTKAFHVPGIQPLPSYLDEISVGDVSGKRFQLQDTTSIINAQRGTGTPGYWENEAELYPNHEQFDSTALGGEDLRGKKVRHHKMPSLHYIKEHLSSRSDQSMVSKYGISVMDILGIRFSGVTVPAALSGKVAGYEILYAKRTSNNITNFGQSLVLFNSIHSSRLGAYTNAVNGSGGSFKNIKNTLIGQNLITTGGNIKAAGKSREGSGQAIPVLESIRIHPFESLAYKPHLTAANMYLTVEWGMVSIFQGPLTMVGNSAQVFRDYTNKDTAKTFPYNQKVIGLAALDYASQGTNYNPFNGVNNSIGESAIIGAVAKGRLTSDVPAGIWNVDSSGGNITESTFANGLAQFRHPGEMSYMVTLKALRSSLYSSFLSQVLIETDHVNEIGDASFCYKGDVYPAKHTYHTYGATGFWDINTPRTDMRDEDRTEALEGTRTIRNVLVESTANLSNRYLIEGEPQSQWIQNTGSKDYIVDFNLFKDPNIVGYSKDLNPLSEGAGVIYNPSADQVVRFPYRIHRGGKMPKEGENRNWRQFLALDYYDMPKNMGEIINLEGLDDALLIHHENALFVTQDKTKLESTDALSVTLGTADIFQFVPQEAASSKLGLAGTKHDLACVLTPMGYMFVDGDFGQVYLFKKGLSLLNGGINMFLREYAKVTSVNPFSGNGITIGYDPEFNRVLLTVKNLGPKLAPDEHIVHNYEETEKFFEKLVPGKSIVFKDGRWQKFLGPL